jgi:hypothetical protein
VASKTRGRQNHGQFQKAFYPISICNANGSIMHSTHEAELDTSMSPEAAKRVYIVPGLATHTLLSNGQLCDAGCDVAFTAEQ